MSSKSSGLRKRDRKVLWHPFCQQSLWMKDEFPVIEKGKGVYLFDVDGKKYLDGVSSLWVNVHGHNNSYLNKAIMKQLNKISHSTFLGQTHRPGIELAEKLIELSPEGLTRVFYSDNGSTAVEVALKMAFQYWAQNSNTGSRRAKFIAFKNAYHGDTIGAVSLGGIELFNKIYKPLLFDVLRADAPYCYRCPKGLSRDMCKPFNWACLNELKAILDKYSDEVIAVVVEPLVQCAGGMITQPKGFLRALRALCDEHKIFLIADEVATGIGRTGKFFACEWEGVKPDFLVLGKGLTGGYLPLAATLTTEGVYEGFLGTHHSERTFFHGHSYTANPLACAVALANLELIKKRKILMNVMERAKELKREIEEWEEEIEIVGEIRTKGLIAGVELVKEKKTKEPFKEKEMIGFQVANSARKRGVLIRPLGNVVVLMPPLCISRKELKFLLNVVREAIIEVMEKNL